MSFETGVGNIKIITYVSVIRDNRILMVEYATPPNPDRKGWWIPAPELGFGEHPEERVASVLENLGLENEPSHLEEIESFENSTGWHLVLHYVVRTTKDVSYGPSIKRHGWFSLSALPNVDEIAHGKWERSVAASRLASVITA